MTSILAVVLLLTAAQGDATTPEFLQSVNPHRQTPLWVALSKAVTPRGELSPEYLDKYARRDLRRAAERHRARIGTTGASARSAVCFGERPAEIFAASNTLAELSANAPTIAKGEIVQRTLGSSVDQPAA